MIITIQPVKSVLVIVMSNVRRSCDGALSGVGS